MDFENIFAIDFEYQEIPGELPTPICAVGKNIHTGEVRYWTCHQPDTPPVFESGPRDLVIAYAAEAEGKCIRQLGWPIPRNCLDLYALFRCHVNKFGESTPASLLSALDHFNLPGLASVEKEDMRKLAMRGGPFNEGEMNALCEYCKTDVEALERLLPKLLNTVHLPLALLFGRYSMRAVAAMQSEGVPLADGLLSRIISAKEDICYHLIAQVDAQFNVYSGSSFQHSKFRSFLEDRGISWPKTKTGQLCLDEQTFKQQALAYPELVPLAELRKTTTTFRNIKPFLGKDGRNRTAIRPFASSTGRNQPSSSSFVYSWPRWFRHLIRPRPGRAIVTLDFGQQEFLIAAALSGDEKMLEAYHSGDPYLATAIRSGRVPGTATRHSHPKERELHKTASLAIQYKCSPYGLGPLVGGVAEAKRLIGEHEGLFRTFHRWSQDQIDRVMFGSPLQTPMGWRIHKKVTTPASELKTRGIANWPVQAAGGDILRIAAIALVEKGFCVIAPVHDAIVIECDDDVVDDVTQSAMSIMGEASAVVLNGQVCRVEAKITMPADNLLSDDAPPMFKRLMSLLN